MTKILLQPEGWARPKGYANAIMAEGRFIFTAGIIGWNKSEKFEHESFIGQFRQILNSTRTLLAEAGASPEDIVRMTCYVTDKQEYLSNLEAIGKIWREEFGKIFPCMAVLEVSGLIEDKAKVEIETTAVLSGDKV